VADPLASLKSRKTTTTSSALSVHTTVLSFRLDASTTTIDLIDDTTPGPIYSRSEAEQLALRGFLDENLNNQFIPPSQSSAGPPVLFIKNKDGSLRLAVDDRSLNKFTKKDRYPLPLIRPSSLHPRLFQARSYNLVRIANGYEWKTAFRTRYGSYKFQVMPYGLTNAPASFQRCMNDFSRIIWACAWLST
jgi:hypothetical protein